MTIKNRVNKLERDSTGSEPLVVVFRTIYEAKDGSVESECRRATIVWGSAKSAFTEMRDDEAPDAFQERLDGYKAMTWQQAQAAPGLIINPGSSQ